MQEKDAQHTPSARVGGVGWASASAGHDQEVHGASRGERTGKHEAGMELPERPRWLHALPENPRCRHRRVLDARDAHGTETVTSSWDRKTKRRGESLWRRSPGGEKWRGCLRGTMWDGRGRTPEPHHMHARDTGDAPGKRCVEPLSLMIQRSATPVKCRRRTPPRWKIGKKWFCGYPEIRPCNGPGPLPGHHRTNDQETRRVVNPDLKKEADGNSQEKNEHKTDL